MRTQQSLDDLLASLPPPQRYAATGVARRSADSAKVVIIDDDPTGSQTSTNVDILTRWDQADIARALRKPDGAFFLLTNHRGYPAEHASRILSSAVHNLAEAARTTRTAYTVVLRSDSTLRGHYPLDMNTARSQIDASGQTTPDLELHVPAFPECGRFTVHGTQWLAVDDTLVAVSDTEYAKDPIFGYTTAYLPQWLGEKSNGVVSPSRVKRIDISQLRTTSHADLSRSIANYKAGTIIVSDGAERSDLQTLAAAIMADHRVAARVIIRSGATFASIFGGVYNDSALSGGLLIKELHLPVHPRVLVVVGSHVQLSTQQLSHLHESLGADFYELPTPLELSTQHGFRLISNLALQARASLRANTLTVVSTPREVDATSRAGYWLASSQMAKSVAGLVRDLDGEYDIIVAKGGVTSSVIITDGIRAPRARVLGQIETGVSVWRPYPGPGRHPAPIVVFPGNVGRADSLTTVVALLLSSDRT